MYLNYIASRKNLGCEAFKDKRYDIRLELITIINVMNYNQQRHIKLLKRFHHFKNQGKSFYKKSPEESLKLYSYNIAVEETIFWQQRYKVDELM